MGGKAVTSIATPANVLNKEHNKQVRGNGNIQYTNNREVLLLTATQNNAQRGHNDSAT